MKKYLSIGLLTVCAAAIAEQDAQAWVNSKFSIGLNWNLQSANNSYLWGLWRNGQIPGPEAFGPGPGGPPPAHYPFSAAPSNGLPQANMAPGYYPQGTPTGYPQYYPQQLPPGFTMQPQPAPQSTAQQPYYAPNLAWNNSYNPYQTVSMGMAPQANMGWFNNANPYQTVSYQPSAYGYNYYQSSYYYYPPYQYEVPYYWYGGR